MPLQTNRSPASADPKDLGIAFAMLDGTKQIPCWISGEALQDFFGAEGTIANMTSKFDANRHRIENVASRKYDRRQLIGGVVRLNMTDFI